MTWQPGHLTWSVLKAILVAGQVSLLWSLKSPELRTVLAAEAGSEDKGRQLLPSLISQVRAVILPDFWTVLMFYALLLLI